MARVRRPFQGVINIVRFNWHFYLIAFTLITSFAIGGNYLPTHFRLVTNILSILAALSISISLSASWYVYDLSDLYQLNWLNHLSKNSPERIANINAGFDETSEIIKTKFPNTQLLVYDFYDQKKHTEVSIRRARNAYPPYPNTQSITTTHVPIAENSFDVILLILSAHEVRNENERIIFFKELNRALKPHGVIYVTEHLRDVSNFLAYNIGFFHFHSKSTWRHCFSKAGLAIQKETKTTPLITTFILCKNGNAY